MKRNLVLVFVLLIVSLSVVGIVVSKLRKNESTQGTPVGATNVAANKVEIDINSLFDIPVYPAARLISSNKELGSAENFYNATWRIGGDNVISQVINWYAGQFAGTGWTKIAADESSLKFAKGTMTVDLKVERGSGYSINIVARIAVKK